ncbi:MAG: VPLPA-CTERM sorting domain-containing protein [Litoreibacter sp.]|nr:VPLPA-CTERM sorting domain-containing protein [Litoreibacter sp.]
MKDTLLTGASVAALLSLATTGAFASTISSVSIIETAGFGTGTQGQTVINGDASLTGTFGTFAEQNADGTSAVNAAANAFSGENKITATAAFEQSETNLTNGARDYTLSYELSGQSADFTVGFGDLLNSRIAAAGQSQSLSATSVSTDPGVAAASVTTSRTSGIAPTNSDNPFTEIDDPEALSPNQFPSPVAAASFEYIIQVNGVTELTARADAILDGFDTAAGLVFDAVGVFTPTATATADGFNFSVGEISGDIDLGTKQAGEEIKITSWLIARAYSAPFFGDGQEPISVNTFSVDPISLSSIGISLTSTPTTPTDPNPTPVPLPAAGWMLIAALGGLGLAKCKRS